MVTAPSTTQPSAPQPIINNRLRRLPGDVLERVGEYLCKAERQQLALAYPIVRLKSPRIWPQDTFLDRLVPRALQQVVPTSLLTPTAPIPARDAALLAENGHRRLWLATYRNLRALEEKVAAGADAQEALQTVCSVRHGQTHDIETLLPLPEQNTVLLIGHEPKVPLPADADSQRETVCYDLGSASDEKGLWPSAHLSVEEEVWQEPRRFVSAGSAGLMAIVDPDNLLHLWHYHDNILNRCVEWRAIENITASSLVFMRGAEAPGMAFFGRFGSSEQDGLHGIKFHFDPNLPRAAPDFEVVQGRSVDDMTEVSSLGLNHACSTAVTVSDDGAVMCRPLPFANAKKFRAKWHRPLSPHMAGEAKISARNDVVALKSKGGGVLVMQPNRGYIQEIWRLPGRVGVTQFDINPEGTRIAMVNELGELQVWSLQSTKLPLSRYTLPKEPIVSISFSPFSHALLVTGKTTTQVVFPLPEPLVVRLPFLGNTATFMPGCARVVGLNASRLFDIDLRPRL